MRRLGIIIVGCAVLSLSLQGCGDVKRAFGLEKTIPNEFDVVDNAPLAVPPDFNLRPPRPGAPPSQQVPASTQARETIFKAGGGGQLPPAEGQRSTGENDLLRAAGAENVPPNIRQLVNREASDSHPFNDNFVDRLLYWRAIKQEQREILNPVKETARLEEHKGAEATISSQFSSPPTIKRKSESGGLFGGLF